MTPLRVFWAMTCLLLLPTLAFGQSLRNVRPRSEPAGPGKVSENPGRAVGSGNPRIARSGKIGERHKGPAIPRPGGLAEPGGRPRDPSNPPLNPAPPLSNLVYLTKHTVSVTVADGIASTEIEQTFKNDAPRQMEASWNCPLPPRSVLHGFSIWMGGKEIHAAVMDRTTARRIYDRIVGRRKDPGLVELMGGNRIRTSIFPIPPKGEFRIRTRYASVVGEGGVVLPMPDSRGTHPIAVVKMDLTVRSARPVSLRTPKSVAVRLTRKDEGRFWSGKFRAKKYRAAGAVNIRCVSRKSEPGLTLNVHRGDRGERTFAAIITAGERTLAKSRLSFDGLKITSMYPAKIESIPPGGSVVVFGRLEGTGKPVCELFARRGLLPVRVKVEAARSSTTAAETRHIPCFWAFGRFDELKKDPKKRSRALDLAIRYGILTEYTALLAK